MTGSAMHETRRPRLETWLVAAAALAAFAAGTYWGTNAVGGSDSHCYVAQAGMYARGQAALPWPIEGVVGWSNVAATFAPSGFTAGPQPGGSVPLCPAGLPYVMMVAMWLGGPGAWFWVVPLFGAVAVWSTYRLGAHVAGDAVGVAAAWLLLCSPTFLYQLFQPMSDVPAAALWTAALALATRADNRAGEETPVPPVSAGWRLNVPLRDALLTGLASALAIVVRPNLAPLAVVPWLLVAWRDGRVHVLRAAWAALVVIAGVAAVVAQQSIVYGSPLQSGYGDLGALFGWANVRPNLARYGSWLAETHGWVLAAAVAAPALVRLARWAWLLLVFAGATVAAYLPYVPFENWSYTRFLLPAIPTLTVLVAAVVRGAGDRATGRPVVATLALLGLVVATAGWWLPTARDLSVFRVKAHERKYPELGRYVAARLPGSAVVLGAQSTGAVRYYADRPTLAWDAIEPGELDRVVDELRARGLTPFIVVESFEADAFRGRFRGQSQAGELDWPPRAVFGRAVSLYDPADRARYVRGERVVSERITWPTK